MPFIIGGIIAAGVGIGAGVLANEEDVGQVNSQANSFDKSAHYDPNKFEWGGQPGLAGQDANYFRGAAGWAQGRQGEQINYTDANWDRFQSGRARWGQEQAAGLMMNRAQGKVPSIAQAQAAQHMGLLQNQAGRDAQQVAAAQASAAASARGAAGLALAGQTAAANTATAQSAINQNLTQGVQGISNQAQVNAMNERLMAEQSAMDAS